MRGGGDDDEGRDNCREKGMESEDCIWEGVKRGERKGGKRIRIGGREGGRL